MGARRPRERNTKLAGRCTLQARTRVYRGYAFTATVRSRRRSWNRNRSAKPFSGNGTPYRSSLRIGRQTATGTSSERPITIATCRSLKSSCGDISANFWGSGGPGNQPETLQQEVTPVEIQPVSRAEFL